MSMSPPNIPLSGVRCKGKVGINNNSHLGVMPILHVLLHIFWLWLVHPLSPCNVTLECKEELNQAGYGLLPMKRNKWWLLSYCHFLSLKLTVHSISHHERGIKGIKGDMDYINYIWNGTMASLTLWQIRWVSKICHVWTIKGVLESKI